RHRVLRRAPLEPEVHGRGDRQQEQRQQQKWVAEAHFPPAQTAETWTMPWPRVARAETTTEFPDLCVVVERLATRSGGGGVGVSNPRAEYQATRRSSAWHAVLIRDVARTRAVTTRRSVGCPGLITAATPVGVLCPPPAAGMQPMWGRKVGAFGWEPT